MVRMVTQPITVPPDLLADFKAAIGKDTRLKGNLSLALREHMQSVVDVEKKGEALLEELPILSHKPMTQPNDEVVQSSMDTFIPSAIKVIAEAKESDLVQFVRYPREGETREGNIEILRTVRQMSHKVLVKKFNLTLTRSEQYGCVGMRYGR